MEVIVGTYDEVILGFRLVQIGKIEASFTDRSHSGCVRCVTVSPKGILASGGTDESIRLLNLRKQTELGSLVHHNGSITSLQFHKGFLFSSSEDKQLCLWKTNTWECLRTFKGHRGAINCLAVHPSGKLAHTIGRDKLLQTWNLMTGRSAFVTNIKQVGDLIKWSPDGNTYVIAANNKLDVYTVEKAEVCVSVQVPGRINCVEYFNNDVCIFGGEAGSLYIHNITENKLVETVDTKTTRIKGLCISPSPVEEDAGEKVLTIASSDGVIQVYKIIEDKESGEISTELLVEHNSMFRITCMSVYCKNAVPDNDNEIKTENDSHEATEVKQSKRKRKRNKKTAVQNDGEAEVLEETEVQVKTTKRKSSDEADINSSVNTGQKKRKKGGAAVEKATGQHNKSGSASSLTKLKKKDKLKKKKKKNVVT